MKDNNLHLLSDEELILLYENKSSIRKQIIAELRNRGIEYRSGKFTQRTIKTAKNIEMFLRECGFEYFASLSKFGYRYPSGVCEYTMTDSKYLYQINGEGISEIETPNDETWITIYPLTNNPNWEKYTYQKKYHSFTDLITKERKVNFSSGLSKWVA